MIIYEVNLSISKTIYKDFEKWLSIHIDKMLTFDGFNDYRIYNISSGDIDNKLLCVHYYLQKGIILFHVQLILNQWLEILSKINLIEFHILKKFKYLIELIS